MNAPPAPAAIHWFKVLYAVDCTLVVGGWLLVAAVALYWLIKVRRDPLAGVPEQPNRLLPDAALLPVGVWLLVGGLLHMAAERLYDGEPSQAAMLSIGDAAQVAGGLVCIWMGGKFFDGGVRRFLFGHGRIARDVARSVVYLLASFAICSVVVHTTLWLLTRVEPDYVAVDHQVVEALRSQQASIWLLWIGAAVIAPIAEECFFRGMLLTALGSFLHSRWLAVVLTGAIFGVIHAGGGDTVQPHVVPAMAVLGVLLGVLYLRTGSLVAPIALHALFNVKTLLWETLLLGGG